MCDTCVKENEKRILLEISNVHDKSGAKYEASVEALTKAFGYDSTRQKTEVSPFKAVRDLEKISKDRVEGSLLALYGMIVSRWIDVQKASADTFILNGRIFLNPKTGKAMTNGQWATIKKDVLKAFDYIYAVEEERIALHALSLGKVIKGLPLEDAVGKTYRQLKPQVDDAMSKIVDDPVYQNAVTFSQQHAGEHITSLTQNQYRKIHDTIQTSIQDRDTPSALKSKLFDSFGEMNRDWRRIAETEISNVQNHGQLIEHMNRAEPGETSFMSGVSTAQACPWCRSEVDLKVVVLLPQAPENGSDQVVVNGETYTAIWPGKSNVGRSRRNWWVAAGTQHPHCRCSWVPYTPGFDKWDKMFRESIDQAMNETPQYDKPIEDWTTTIKNVPWN